MGCGEGLGEATKTWFGSLIGWEWRLLVSSMPDMLVSGTMARNTEKDWSNDPPLPCCRLRSCCSLSGWLLALRGAMLELDGE